MAEALLLLRVAPRFQSLPVRLAKGYEGGFAQALVENIWCVHGKEITAPHAGWLCDRLVCGLAYRFVPKSAVLMSRRVHELLADRYVAETRRT